MLNTTMFGRRPRDLARLAAAAITLLAHGVAIGQDRAAAEKVVRIPVQTAGPRTLDPAYGTSVYDNQAASQVYETLLEYNYFKRPLELQPLLAAEMPAVSEDGRTYRFRLRDDVYFTDDPCFPGGEGRRLRTDDVFYSWKRLADPRYTLQAWPKLDGLIVGLNAYKDEQNDRVARGEPFDYEAPVAGLRKINDLEFEVELTEANRQFLWKIATFQLSVVPREAVETYGDRINRVMVGTGPFKLAEWKDQTHLHFVRNPDYRDVRYPDASAMMPDDVERGWDADAGKRLPLVDRLEFTFFVEDQPRWIEFTTGANDFVQVPNSAFEEAFNPRTKRLRSEWVRDGVDYQPVPLLDFIYRGFNMDDPVVGGYTKERAAFRRAISLCMNWDELNESLYDGIPIIYDGCIPPGVPGHPEGGRLSPSNRGPDLARARELLREAGFEVGPDGRAVGVPPIDLWTSQGSQSEKIVGLFLRDLEKVGIPLNPRYVDFAKLTDALDNSQAPMFSLAWASAYPDAEYSLQLFYGPNEAPGPNAFNFRNAEYDELYRSIKVLPPGDERDAAYARMQAILTEHVPFMGSQARVRQYLIHPWLENFKATETFYNYTKYLDVDTEHPDRPR